jgi:hypothetical protein
MAVVPSAGAMKEGMLLKKVSALKRFSGVRGSLIRRRVHDGLGKAVG